jgi:hypothetical protein
MASTSLLVLALYPLIVNTAWRNHLLGKPKSGEAGNFPAIALNLK